MKSLWSFPLVLLLAACASATSSSGTEAGDAAQGSRNGPISAEMARSAGAANAYDLVQSLRSNWLRKRGGETSNAPSEIIVYLDDTRMGGLETLRQIATTNVFMVEFVDARTAQFRWGPGHTNGVILVRTR